MHSFNRDNRPLAFKSTMCCVFAMMALFELGATFKVRVVTDRWNSEESPDDVYVIGAACHGERKFTANHEYGTHAVFDGRNCPEPVYDLAVAKLQWHADGITHVDTNLLQAVLIADDDTYYFTFKHHSRGKKIPEGYEFDATNVTHALHVRVVNTAAALATKKRTTTAEHLFLVGYKCHHDQAKFNEAREYGTDAVFYLPKRCPDNAFDIAVAMVTDGDKPLMEFKWTHNVTIPSNGDLHYFDYDTAPIAYADIKYDFDALHGLSPLHVHVVNVNKNEGNYEYLVGIACHSRNHYALKVSAHFGTDAIFYKPLCDDDRNLYDFVVAKLQRTSDESSGYEIVEMKSDGELSVNNGHFFFDYANMASPLEESEWPNEIVQGVLHVQPANAGVQIMPLENMPMSVGKCVNGLCPAGYRCHKGHCVPLGQPMPTSTMPDGEPLENMPMSIGECVNGRCPDGYRCHKGHCVPLGQPMPSSRMPMPTSTMPTPTATMPDGECVNGRCPDGYYCDEEEYCVPTKTDNDGKPKSSRRRNSLSTKEVKTIARLLIKTPGVPVHKSDGKTYVDVEKTIAQNEAGTLVVPIAGFANLLREFGAEVKSEKTAGGKPQWDVAKLLMSMPVEQRKQLYIVDVME